MNIILCINKNFLNPAIVTLTSAIVNNKNSKIKVFILHNDLSDKDIYLFTSNFINRYFISINFIKVDNEKYFVNQFKGQSRWPIEVFYRLIALYLIPDSIERYLYLDADVIINESIENFYSLDFEGKYIIACEDSHTMYLNSYQDRLKVKENHIYFNSGVLIFNTKLIKKDFTLDNILTFIKDFNNDLVFPDQDILNAMFDTKVLIQDFRKYNFICDQSRYSKKYYKNVVNYAKIFHFGGNLFYKPWSLKYIGNLNHIWFKYAKITVLKDRYRIIYFLNLILKPAFQLQFSLISFLSKLKNFFDIHIRF